MTKKFNVQAHYIVYLEVEIDAESENAAWEKAQDLFGGLSFEGDCFAPCKQYGSDWEVDDILEV